MKRVIISVTNDLDADQRVNKVANSLVCAGFSVLLVGRIQKKSNILKTRKYECHRLKLVFNKGFLFYFEFNIRLFFFLLGTGCDILLSNDLDTLPANFCISKLRNRKLIYDSHELFTEVPELINRPVVKFIWKSIEWIYLRRIKFAYTVSDSIANYYHQKYGINMLTIRNFPLTKQIDYIENSKDFKKIIYQGSINKDRGIGLMISAMKYVDAKLYIIGSGDILEDMIQYVKRLQLEHKVVFTGKISFHELFNITQSADLGLSFEEDTCLAYRHSLPNKIFDYINAEIPILVSDLPEFKKIISIYAVGMILKSRDAKEVSKQINQLISIPKESWRSKILLAKKDCCWRNEEQKLLSLFN